MKIDLEVRVEVEYADHKEYVEITAVRIEGPGAKVNILDALTEEQVQEITEVIQCELDGADEAEYDNAMERKMEEARMGDD